MPFKILPGWGAAVACAGGDLSNGKLCSEVWFHELTTRRVVRLCQPIECAGAAAECIDFQTEMLQSMDP